MKRKNLIITVTTKSLGKDYICDRHKIELSIIEQIIIFGGIKFDLSETSFDSRKSKLLIEALEGNNLFDSLNLEYIYTNAINKKLIYEKLATNNFITSAIIDDLEEVNAILKVNNSLRSIDLIRNNDTSSKEELAKSLMINNSLDAIYFRNDNINSNHIKNIGKMLLNNNSFIKDKRLSPYEIHILQQFS